MSATHVFHELPFLAPVPRGHDVLVAIMKRSVHSDQRVPIVIDRTDGVVYTNEHVWSHLPADAAAHADPVSALLRNAWIVSETTEGRVAVAFVVSSNAGNQNCARTRLFLEAPSAAYR